MPPPHIKTEAAVCTLYELCRDCRSDRRWVSTARAEGTTAGSGLGRLGATRRAARQAAQRLRRSLFDAARQRHDGGRPRAAGARRDDARHDDGTTAGSGHDARDSTARRRHDGGQWPRAAGARVPSAARRERLLGGFWSRRLSEPCPDDLPCAPRDGDRVVQPAGAGHDPHVRAAIAPRHIFPPLAAVPLGVRLKHLTGQREAVHNHRATRNNAGP